MNVTFLNPPNTDSDTYMARSSDRWPHRVRRGRFFRNKIFAKYPLYMAYAAAVTERAGHRTRIVDAARDDLSQAATVARIHQQKPDLLVIEVAEASLRTDLACAEALKAATGAVVAIYGPTASTFDTDLATQNTFLDVIIRGECFATLEPLLHRLHQPDQWDDVQGITMHRDGNLVRTEDMPLYDIEDLPRPARHLLDPARYLLGHYTYTPQIHMVSSIGCPHQCIFCLWPQTMYGPKMRYRDPTDVALEMHEVKEAWGAREIYFDDDTFNVTINRAMEVSQAIVDSGVQLAWMCEARCDQVSEELLHMMKRAGCTKILYGVESGSQLVQDNSGKHLQLEDVRRAFRLTHQAGIRTHATSMFGLPGETDTTIRQTIEFLKELKPDTIQASLAMPYPGTKFYDMAVESGWLKASDLAEFDGETGGTIEYPGLSKEAIRTCVNRAYREYYFRPAYIATQLRRMTSWADVKRIVNLASSGIRRFS